jgi:cytochrome c
MTPARIIRMAAALALTAAVAGATAAGAETAQAVASGEAVFARQCATCHKIGEGAKHGVGPQLNRLFGRRAGSVEGYSFSKAMRHAGDEGLVWDHETLAAYLESPKALVTGTKMNYRGLKDAAQRADLIAFLRSLSDNPADLPESPPTLAPEVANLPAEVLAIKGDPAYGEYLASECSTCHRRDGTDEGIPVILGWPEEDFVRAMHAYKQKLRPHPVMQMMAGRLSNEEIAALAAYFAKLE